MSHSRGAVQHCHRITRNSCHRNSAIFSRGQCNPQFDKQTQIRLRFAAAFTNLSIAIGCAHVDGNHGRGKDEVLGGYKMVRYVAVVLASLVISAFLIPISLCRAEIPELVGNVAKAYSGQVAAHLERSKHFPAEGKGAQGVVKVGFTIDRLGHLLSKQVVESSGIPALDKEAIALVERSQPFPIPPSELVDADLNFTIPVVFRARPPSKEERIDMIAAEAQTQVQPQPQMPPGFDRVEFFGVVLARMSFCGMFQDVDQYELAVAMKAFGVTSADRPAIEVSQDKNYQILRAKSKTAREHADFCIENRSWPFFIKAARKGLPLLAGSDTSKQPEKIEQFGNLLGALVFCKIDVDGNKWGRFLWDMGLKSESMSAMADQAKRQQQALIAENTPQRAAKACREARTNPDLYRFNK